MHIKPYLGEEIGHGKSGFAVNRGAVNRGFTVVKFNSTQISASTHTPYPYVDGLGLLDLLANIQSFAIITMSSKCWMMETSFAYLLLIYDHYSITQCTLKLSKNLPI